jgi:chitinase
VDGAFRLFHNTFGIPAGKINLGVPFYGQTFTNCTGVDAPHAGADTVHFSKQGAFYYDIVENMHNFTRYWDDHAKVPYLVSSSWKMFVSYDDEESVAFKARYVLEHGARGVIIWESTGDYMPDGTTPLLDVISSHFNISRQKRN